MGLFMHLSLLSDELVNVLSGRIFIDWLVGLVYSFQDSKMFFVVHCRLEFFMENFLPSHVILNFSY